MSWNSDPAVLTVAVTGADVRMLIGNGYAPDRGAYALELFRRDERLRAALAEPAREPV